MRMRLSGIGMEYGELVGNAKNVGNQSGNQSGNLSITVEMTPIGNGNDKFKEWREVRITENVHTFVPHI